MKSSMLKNLLLAGLLAVFCAGCGEHGEDDKLTPQELYVKGCRCYDAGDLSDAVGYFRQAAERGHAKAQYRFGVCHFKGIVVPEDHGLAVYWWQKSAEQGYAEAQYELIMCYAKGDGIPRDLSKAYDWFRKYAKKKYTKEEFLRWLKEKIKDSI